MRTKIKLTFSTLLIWCAASSPAHATWTLFQQESSGVQYYFDPGKPTDTIAVLLSSTQTVVDFEGVKLTKLRGPFQKIKSLFMSQFGISNWTLDDMQIEKIKNGSTKVVTRGNYVGVRNQIVYFEQWETYSGREVQTLSYMSEKPERPSPESIAQSFTPFVSNSRSPAAAAEERDGPPQSLEDQAACLSGKCGTPDNNLNGLKEVTRAIEENSRKRQACDAIDDKYRDYKSFSETYFKVDFTKEALAAGIYDAYASCFGKALATVGKNAKDFVIFIGSALKGLVWDVAAKGVVGNTVSFFTDKNVRKDAVNSIKGVMAAGWNKVKSGVEFVAQNGYSGVIEAGNENLRANDKMTQALGGKMFDLFMGYVGKQQDLLRCLHGSARADFLCDWLGEAVSFFVPPAAALKLMQSGLMAAKVSKAFIKTASRFQKVKEAVASTRLVKALNEAKLGRQGMKTLLSAEELPIHPESLSWVTDAKSGQQFTSIGAYSDGSPLRIFKRLKPGVYAEVKDTKKFEKSFSSVQKILSKPPSRIADTWVLGNRTYAESASEYLSRLGKELKGLGVPELSKIGKSERRNIEVALSFSKEFRETFAKIAKRLGDPLIDSQTRKKVLELIAESALKTKNVPPSHLTETLDTLASKAMALIDNRNEKRIVDAGLRTVKSSSSILDWQTGSNGFEFVKTTAGNKERTFVRWTSREGNAITAEVKDFSKFKKEFPLEAKLKFAEAKPLPEYVPERMQPLSFAQKNVAETDRIYLLSQEISGTPRRLPNGDLDWHYVTHASEVGEFMSELKRARSTPGFDIRNFSKVENAMRVGDTEGVKAYSRILKEINDIGKGSERLTFDQKAKQWFTNSKVSIKRLSKKVGEKFERDLKGTCKCGICGIADFQNLVGVDQLFVCEARP